MAAAYAALVSLMQTIDLIEHHPFPPISLDKQQVESLTEIVTFLQEFLEGYNSPFADRDEADPLEMRIADAAYAAEDVIETHIVDRSLPRRKKMGFLNCFRSLNITSTDLYEGLQKVIGDMDLIKKEVMEIAAEEEVVQQYSASAGSSTSSLPRLNSTVLGSDDLKNQLMEKLIYGRVDRQVIPIVGMGGIGKTTLARNIYEWPSIKAHFDICAWATISQQYNTKEILCEILSPGGSESLSKMREDEVGLALHKYLSYRRFLIVLDDMWSVEAWEEIQRFFPENGNGSRIMVTTRLSNLGSQLDKDYGLKMKFLDEGSSWNMFSNIVFGGKSCPLELEKIGKKIVRSCGGLPLSILVMGGVLEKLEQTKKCWKSIRRSLNSIVNSENDDHCLKILKLSYNHLPVHLKPCFLYMGVFDEDSVIKVSPLIKQWVSEGFLKPVRGQILETIAKEYLKELIDRNLVLVHKLGSTGNVKSCKIHDLLRDLCLREAQKEMFYHVVGQRNPRGTNKQRRIVIPRSTSKKKVLDALKSTPQARSYISDYERVRLLPNLRLLRTVRAFGNCGMHNNAIKKMVGLVNLRFLLVRAPWHTKFPSAINLLWSLQTLVVFSPPRADVNASVEIWKMPQLRHVKLYGQAFHLTDPPSDNDIIMENLQTLVEVRDFKFDEEVIRRIPNIKKLRIIYSFRINENESYDEHYCFHNIERLRKLESLNCEFNLRGDFVEKVTFPPSLKSLTLQIMRGSFQYMSRRISSFPLLQKLKLDGGWASTRKWTTVEGQFPRLKCLSLVKGGKLKYWRTESSHFPCLEHLYLRGVKLEKIPTEIGEIPTLKSIVLVDCSASAVKSMKAIVEEQEGLQVEVPFKVEVLLRKENEELQNLANPNFQVKRWTYEWDLFNL